MGTWAWDPAGDAHRRDASLNVLLGLPAEETVGPLDDFLTHMHPDDRDPVRAAFDKSVRHGRPLNTEFRAVRPDGSVRWLRDQGDVFDTTGEPRLIGACVDVTDLKEAEAALRDARDRLEERVAERTEDLGRAMDSLAAEMDRRRELGRQLGTAQEDERRRVARDLHDTVGQLMAGLSLGFKAIETGGHLPPPAAARLAEAQRIMNDLARELHGLAVRLRPTSLDDIGLESALGQLVSEWSARVGVRADFHASGVEPGRLPPEVETAVYRVVQEALTNVVKHAKATLVSVVVTRPDGFVSVAVEDDGVGFDPDASPKGRLGLVGMRERVEVFGGTIDIESSPGSGTTVLVQIPIPKGGAS
jgi:PAS domain S-box-containing protein